MKVEKDYKELLELLNKHKVKYCIIGAYAVGFYGAPRYTKDIDIFIEPTQTNAKKILKALEKFGFGNLGLKEEDFIKRGNIIQLGYEPVRIDIVNSLSGCSFDEVWRNKTIGEYGDQKVFFIGLKQLIKTKKKTNRIIDKDDIEKLKRRNKIKFL